MPRRSSAENGTPSELTAETKPLKANDTEKVAKLKKDKSR